MSSRVLAQPAADDPVHARGAYYAGAAAPLLYVVGVTLGGLITPGYSHVANMISELTMVGSPYRPFLAAIFVLYNLLLVAFALSLPRTDFGGDRWSISIGSTLLVVIAIAGIGMSALFPTDRPTDPLTTIGWVHVGLAATASLGTMAAVFAFAWALWRAPGWRGFATFSFACLVGIAASGIWTATTTAQLSPIMGLTERITIGVFMVWLLAFAMALIRRSLASSH